MRLAATLLILLAAAPRALAAQEEAADTAAADAPQDTIAADTLDAAPARPRYNPPRVSFSFSFGTLGFGALQTQPVRAERLAEDGSVSATELLRRDLHANAGIQAGLSALIGLGPAWAARVGAAYGRATLEAGYDGESEQLVEEAGGIAPAGDAGIRLLLWEAALRFRIPSSRRLQPYAELGIATVRWSADAEDGAFPGAAALADPQTRWGPLLALGGDVPLLPWLSARFQASTRLVRTPFSPVADRVPLGEGDSLALSFAAPADALFADPTRELTHVVRLEAGLSLELGRIRRPDPPRAESDASGSGSRR